MGTYVAAAANLPSTVTVVTRGAQIFNDDGTPALDSEGNFTYEEVRTSRLVAWTLTDTNVGAMDEGGAESVYKDYIRYTGEGTGTGNGGAVSSTPGTAGTTTGTQYLQVLTDVSFTTVGKIGNLTLAEDLQGEREHFSIRITVNNTPISETYSLNALIESGYLSWRDEAEGEGDLYDTGVLSGRLPLYNYQNETIVYGLRYTDPDAPAAGMPHENTDYYVASYDNANSPNHVSATDAAYNGGTLNLTHVGSTTFTAIKAWLDNGAVENRPAVTFTLWRYSNGATAGNSQTAAQVSDGAGGFVTIRLDAGSPSSTVDLGKLLKEQYPNLVLAKYDPDGYPYVYAVQEQTAANSLISYEAVYGSVDAETGETDDTGPNYYDIAGTGTIEYEAGQATRPAYDRMIYNGGTLSNRLTGTVEVSATKTWNVAAFQDQFEDVSVTFTLQQRAKGSADAWENATADGTAHGEVITRTLGNFIAEQLTQTVTGTYPKYSNNGVELEYRWVETGVSKGEQDTQFTRDEATNTASFQLTVENTAEGGTETLNFTSAVVDGDTIVNSFDNTTAEYVDKWWQSEDGTFSQNPPDPQIYENDVTVKLFQDNALVGEFTMTGEGLLDLDFDDATAGYSIDGVPEGEQVHVDETRMYHLEFTNLPKYSETGHRYQYLVIEETVEGWHSEREYDAEQHLTTIRNYLPIGEGSEVAVTKWWIDGDDAQHRLNSIVGVYAAHDMASATLADPNDPESGPRTSYAAGELIGVAVLTADDAWYTEFEIGIGGLDHDDLVFVELGLSTEGAISGDDLATIAKASSYANGTVSVDGTSLPSSITYPAYTEDQAKAAAQAASGGMFSAIIEFFTGASQDWDWVNEGWTEGTRRIATDNHVYEVGDELEGGSYNQDMETYQIDNRRLGLIDFTVDKTWWDSFGDFTAADDTANTRPSANYVLECTTHDAVFSLGADGTLYAQLSEGNRIPIEVLDANGDVVSGVSVDDRGRVIIPVDRRWETSTYRILGLPKYDGAGLLASYTLTEEWATNDHGDYGYSRTVGEYTVGARHFHDSQVFSFSNRRVGTTSVVFYKQWNDRYVRETLNQRPDIYLTLYKVSAETNNLPEVVEGYVNYLWQADAGGTSDYAQQCTISDLPKYDGVGDEITYYATEIMANNGESLHYAAVTFSMARDTRSEEPVAWDLSNGVGAAAAPLAAESDLEGKSGATIAIRANGTFINSLEGTVEVNGEKLWQNIPSGFPTSELPSITVFIQQRVAGTEWPSLYVTVNDDGTVSYNEGASGAGGAVASAALSTTGEPVQSGTRWSYSIGSDFNGASLPRYTEDGQLYEYRAREVIIGLLNSYGGAGEEEFESMDWSTDAYTPADGDVYTIAHGASGSFLINNIYEPNKGSLTVKKIFDGRAAGDAYPNVTYTIERSYDGTTDWQYVTEHTITAGEFAAADAEAGGTGNATLAYTFEDLDVYAPDGSKWVYRIVETGIDGYTTYAGAGDLTLDETKAAGESSTVEGLESDEREYTGGDQTGDYDTAPDATFANDYVPADFSITGAKRWNDYRNAFGLRPAASELSLTLTRSAGGQSETLFENRTIASSTEFKTADGKAFTFAWSESASSATDDTWAFTISGEGIERYAPNGTPWTYTLTENETAAVGGDSSYYRIQVASAAATGRTLNSNNEASFNRQITNQLKGSASVEKIWNDSDNPYGLRPLTVEVQLQARVMDGGATSNNGWKEANAALADYATDFAGLTTTRTLSDVNDWKASWSQLPTHVNVSGSIYEIEYRVIETKVGDVEVAFGGNSAADEGSLYTNIITNSYATSQETTQPDETSYSTAITNTLQDKRASVTKIWDDQDNKWSTRPAASGQWSVKYYLLSTTVENSTDVGDYGFVYRADSDLPVAGASLADQMIAAEFESDVISGTVTGSLDSGDGTFITTSISFENLPSQDAEGNTLYYAWAEEVQHGYDVSVAEGSGSIETVGTNAAGRTVVLHVGAADASAYTNTLDTVGLTGTKIWNDYGTGLAPECDGATPPTMTLYRSTNAAATSGINVASLAGQPTWSEGADGTWTFSYTGLPETSPSGAKYYYWATETVGSGSASGFYPVYATSGAAGSIWNETGDSFTSTDITNVATRFTLEKTNDAGDRLNGIQLSVMSSDKNTVYAVWERDANGTMTSWVNPAGAAYATVKSDSTDAVDTGKLAANGFTVMPTDQAGYIIGLKAGTYTVVETGGVPEYHVQAADVAVTIAANGTITSDALTVSGSNPGRDSTLTVTLVDPIFRAHIELTKTLGASTALAGATFDLYRMDGDAPDPSNDAKIAEGITTGADGTWSSKDDGASVSFIDGNDDGKRTHLSDGLLPGTYYFVETGFPETAYDDPSVTEMSSAVAIAYEPAEGETGHLGTAQVSMQNTPYSSAVLLKKHDSTSGEGIQSAQFRLDRLTGGTLGSGDEQWTQVGGAQSTGTDGLLAFSFSQKGTYRITETANEGYDMTEPFQATFVLSDDDYTGADGAPIDLTTAAGRTAVEYNQVAGSMSATDGQGIPNERLTGTATMFKTASVGSVGGLDGAVFTLQKQGADGSWVDVVAGLETGSTYDLSEDNATATEDTGAATQTGYLTVNNLLWGTYRFVEISQSAGYVEPDGVTSKEFTIGRTSLSASLTGNDSVRNVPTRFVIQKQDAAGSALDGATFTVTPQQGSAFADGTTGAKTMTSAAGGTHSLTAQLLVGGTYEVVETVAPSGYTAIQGTLTIHVEDDGTISTVGDVPSAYQKAAEGVGAHYTFTAVNTPICLKAVKTDESGTTQLAGAVFELTGLCSDNQSSHELSVGQDGAVELSGLLLPGQTYTLHEVSSPAGYKVNGGMIRFSIDSAGVFANVETTPEDGSGYAISLVTDEGGANPCIQVTVADKQTEIVLHKATGTGDDRISLEGAEFAIVPEAGSAFADGSTGPLTVTTDSDGLAPVTGKLVCGNTYTVSETKAPEGYERVTSELTLALDHNGDAEIVGTPSSEWSQVTGTNEFRVSLSDTPIEAEMGKYGLDGNAALAGAEFTVEGAFADGSTEKRYVSGADGIVPFDSAQLVAGEAYTIVETKAPEGYELIEGGFQFSVNEDGTLTAVGDEAAAGEPGFAITSNNLRVSAYDAPIEIELAKVDAEGKSLVGAQFTLTGVFADGNGTVGEQEERTYTLSEGTALLDGLVAGAEYLLAETVPPEGYRANATPLSFSVNEDGTIQAESEAEGYAISNGDTVGISVANDPTEFTLVKSDPDGGALAGAEFLLVPEEGSSFASGASSIELVTDEAGSIEPVVGELVVGDSYVLTEVTAPAGYELIDHAWSFSVGEDGALSGEATSDGSAAGYLIEGAATVRAIDDPTPVSIVGTSVKTGDSRVVPLVGGVTALAATVAVAAACRGVRRSRRERG